MDLDALEAALAALPKTPWTFEEHGIDAGVIGTDRRVNPMYGERCEGAVYDDDTDAAAIVAIMNAAPALIALARAGQNMRVIVRRESCSLEPDGEALTTALRAYDAATKGGG